MSRAWVVALFLLLGLSGVVLVACRRAAPPAEMATAKQERALLRAATQGDTQRVIEILQQAPEAVRTTQEGGMTPLHLAALSMQLDIVRLLLDHGAPIDARADDGSTPISLAARRGNRRVVQELLKRGARTDLPDDDGFTCLHWAVCMARDSTVAVLLAGHADPDAQDVYGRTPHMLAHRLGPPALAGMFEPADKVMPLSPLAEMAEQANWRGVSEALRANPDRAREIDAYGCTPWHWAARRFNVYTISNLVGLFALDRSLDIAGPYGLTTVHYAVWGEGNSLLVRIIIHDAGNLDARDAYGATPLHWALRLHNSEMAMTLIQNGADPHFRDEKGRTPLFLAHRNGMGEVEQALRERGIEE